MAKLIRGILGPIEGKIGTIIGSSWKGIPYIRSAPVSYENYKPKTEAKTAAVKKFQFLHAWLNPFRDFVIIGFKNHAQACTELNAAFSANYHTTVKGQYPDFEIDYNRAVFSKGNLLGLTNASAQFLDAETLQVTWSADYHRSTHYNDQLMLIVYSESLKMADGFIGGTKRNQGACRFKLHPKFLGQALHIYVSMMSPDLARVSNTEYLGRKEPL